MSVLRRPRWRRRILGGNVRLLFCAFLILAGGCDSRSQTASPAPATTQTNKGSSPDLHLRVRAPAVAGLFYPADAQVLSKTIDSLLEKAGAQYIPRLRALVCPHAGYEFSGLTAAYGYRALAGRDVQTVVILGPSHYAWFQGASVPDADAFQTPLGIVPISSKAREMSRTSPFLLEARCPVQRPEGWRRWPKPAPAPGDDTPETWEHSVEVQVPFLQKTLANFTILPVVFGETDPAQAANVLGGMIDDKTFIVASSDLSHYHAYKDAEELDHRCVKAICDLDMEQMKKQEACGKTPILTLMALARLKGWKTRLLDYRNSGDTSGNKDRVVGYSAVAFYEPRDENVPESARKFLLDLARKTLSCVASNGSLPQINAAVPPELATTRACFVTLTKNGELRGCIGHILPQEALYKAVADNTRSAAIRDWRFKPVRSDELANIKIEISVLTEPRPLAFSSPEDLLNKLRPYEDGVLLKIGPRNATFLPQVWSQIPGKVPFLNQLAQKAGCEPSAWRGKDTTISTYQVESFEEE